MKVARVAQGIFIIYSHLPTSHPFAIKTRARNCHSDESRLLSESSGNERTGVSKQTANHAIDKHNEKEKTSASDI